MLSPFICHMQAHEGIEQLKVNLKKEHDLKVDYMTAVWISVSHYPLQSINTAQCSVVSAGNLESRLMHAHLVTA